MSQNYARKYSIPVDTLAFDHNMMDEDKYDSPPDEGVYVYGPFCEACRWDKQTKLLDESEPKVLFSPMPVMHFMPAEKVPKLAVWTEEERSADGVPVSVGYYVAPLYNTAAR